MPPDRRSDAVLPVTLADALPAPRQWWHDLDRGWRATVIGVLIVAAAVAL